MKLAREQKKRQDFEAAGRLAAQRQAAEQATRELAEADAKQKRADRQNRVRHSTNLTPLSGSHSQLTYHVGYFTAQKKKSYTPRIHQNQLSCSSEVLLHKQHMSTQGS